MNMNHIQKDEDLLRSRLDDLASASYRRQAPAFGPFLGLNEQNIFHSMEKGLAYAGPVLFGGYPNAERQMAGFLPDALCFMEKTDLFPISCIRITPRDQRFSEGLNHRDILGAVLHLGIDRSKTGDILLREDEAFLFAETAISSFIIDELLRIRRTYVHCEKIDPRSGQLPPPRTEQIEGTVSSPRIDTLISMAFHASRTSLKDLPKAEKVFRNGRMVTDGSVQACEGDLISVRGYGRFRFLGETGTSRKGRHFVVLEKYQ